MNKKFCTVGFFLILVIVISIVAGAVLLIMGDKWIKDTVNKETVLADGTITYKQWRNSTVPMYVWLYVFDLGENLDFLSNGGKPILKQRGPFVYREFREKISVESYGNGTISYQEPRSYRFEPSLSGENENVTITTMNLVYMTLVKFLQLKDTPNSFKKIIGDILSYEEKPWITLTARELLWGYHDALLADLKKRLPHLVQDDVISVFNASTDQLSSNIFLINNGRENISKVGHVERLNFENRTNFWSDAYANMLNGTDGTLSHPDMQKSERVYTFIPDICRSVYLDFNESRTNNFDIDVLHFTVPDAAFARTGENHGFCLNTTEKDKNGSLECLPSGLFSLSSCVHLSGSSISIPLPIVASSPHFLGADPNVQKSVDGLSPSEALHRSFVDIEPITGLVMNGSRRLQVNLHAVNDSMIDPVSNLTSLYFPLIWINEHAEIDQPNADIFQSKVQTPIKIIFYVKYASFGLAGLFILIVAAFFFHAWRRSQTTGAPFLAGKSEETQSLRI